jgi:nitroreductase
MDALEAIMTTRAIRRFTDEPVTADEIATCLEAAGQAPSGGNVQPWRFVVVTDPEQRRRVGEVYRGAYDRYEPALLASLPPFRTPEDEASFHRTSRASRRLAHTLGDVPVLVAVCAPDIDLTLRDDQGPLDIGHLCASVYPAVQNLLVAARAQGIGGTMTTVFRIHHAQMRRVLGIPDGVQIHAIVALGRPRGRFGRARRIPVHKLTYRDRWGERA